MSRLDTQRNAAMDRNVRALTLHCEAFEYFPGFNAHLSRAAEPVISREAQFDIEGATCWRDPHAARCGA